MAFTYIDQNRFTERPMETNPQEEAFARDWAVLLDRFTGKPWALLREMFVELDFPVAEHQSENPAFMAALKRGIRPPAPQDAWTPVNPEGVRVYLHPTPAGRLPVIECETDADFVRLQQSLVYRCEPRPVPDARGATIIKNYNNWARINMHRTAPSGGIPADPAQYRDYIVLLSHRYYSGVQPEVFGLQNADWRRKSLILRREHEVAHYMTQRFYHSAKNEIHDETIADFMGLTAAFGSYDPMKFLTFLGLENHPAYRVGGRLELYLSPEDKHFGLLCSVLPSVAQNIADRYAETGGDRIAMFHTLCRTPIADIARGRFYDGA